MEINLTTTQATLLALALVWELVWKGFALWKAAKYNDQRWFITLMIVSSIGVLPILYLLLRKLEPSKAH